MIKATINKTLPDLPTETITTIRHTVSKQIKSNMGKNIQDWIRYDKATSILRQQIGYDQIRNDYLSFNIQLKLDTGTIIILFFIVDHKQKQIISNYSIRTSRSDNNITGDTRRVPNNQTFAVSIVDDTFDMVSDLLKELRK